MLRSATLAVLGLTFAVASGCGGKPKGEESPKKVYTVRGLVRDLPNPQRPGSEFSVHHEAIDDFVGIRGEVVGMSSMTMPFPVADGIDLDGVAVGDPVEITMEIDWDGDPPVLVTAVRELPAGTPLEFRKARPPTD